MNNKRFVIIAVIAAILLVGGAAYYWEVVNPAEEFDCAPVEEEAPEVIERFEQTDRYRRIDENLIKGEVIRTARNRYEYSYFGNTLRYVDSVVYKADNGYLKTLSVDEVISLTE